MTPAMPIPPLLEDGRGAYSVLQSNLLLWTLKNKDASIVRTVGCNPSAI